MMGAVKMVKNLITMFLELVQTLQPNSVNPPLCGIVRHRNTTIR